MYTANQNRTIDAAALLNAANTQADCDAALAKIQESFAACFWVDRKAAARGLAARKRRLDALRAEHAAKQVARAVRVLLGS